MGLNQADHMLSYPLCEIQRDKVLEIENMEGGVLLLLMVNYRVTPGE